MNGEASAVGRALSMHWVIEAIARFMYKVARDKACFLWTVGI